MYSPSIIKRNTRLNLPAFRMPGVLRHMTMRQIAISAIKMALMVDLIVVPIVLFKLFIFSGPMPLTMAAQRYSGTAGPATSDFIRQLQNSGLSPTVVGTVKRSQFSVSGALVAISGDSFQTFEYPDHISALESVTSMSLRYSASSRSVSWKRQVHLYADGKLAIYYFGSRESTLNILGQYAGLSMTDSLIPALAAAKN